MGRAGISFTSSTMVKVLLIVLALAVLFGFVDWAVGGVSTILGYVQWGSGAEMEVDTYNIDPSADPPFEVTFTFTNTASSEQEFWVRARGASGTDLGSAPPDDPQNNQLTVEGHGSTRESISYTGDTEDVGCQFKLTAFKRCELASDPLCGWKAAHLNQISTIATATVRIPEDRRPDAWGEDCPAGDSDDGGFWGGVLRTMVRVGPI